ncbi:hypothetical protein [Streptomyces clavuligerus]|uniref:hypothetical protein n=1 Tax=Streptomyces clavuligerus TaxID=1901 RepID=UPI0039775A0F
MRIEIVGGGAGRRYPRPGAPGAVGAAGAGGAGPRSGVGTFVTGPPLLARRTFSSSSSRSSGEPLPSASAAASVCRSRWTAWLLVSLATQERIEPCLGS